MSSSSKARASGVSSSSFLDLQAELSTRREEQKRQKAEGKTMVKAAGRAKDKVSYSSNSSTKVFEFAI